MIRSALVGMGGLLLTATVVSLLFTSAGATQELRTVSQSVSTMDDETLAQTSPRISDQPPLSLEHVLGEIGQSPRAAAAASEIAAAISRRVGRPIQATEFAKTLKDPRRVTHLFSVRITDLASGFATAQVVADVGGAAGSENSFKMPNKVTWTEAPTYFDATPWKPEQLFGSLFRYAIPSGISAQEFRLRSALGEILDRLALNRSKQERDRFTIVYQDAGYSDFDTFVEALGRTGHRIEMDVCNEVADFLHIMFRRPDGAYQEVRTEIRLRTGYFTAAGDEITVPAVHSHLIFRVAGPHLNAAVEFYQGTHGTHFYPSFVVKGESWVGLRKSATFGGPQAVRAIKAAALYLDLLQTISREDSLFAGGYGQSGICNDSVAVIELLLKTKATVYPLLIDKKRILRHLDAFIAKRPNIAQRYQEIREAVEQMPSDVLPNPTQPQRILDSIPYESGSTPYAGYNDARNTFGKCEPPR